MNYKEPIAIPIDEQSEGIYASSGSQESGGTTTVYTTATTSSAGSYVVTFNQSLDGCTVTGLNGFSVKSDGSTVVVTISYPLTGGSVDLFSISNPPAGLEFTSAYFRAEASSHGPMRVPSANGIAGVDVLSVTHMK